MADQKNTTTVRIRIDLRVTDKDKLLKYAKQRFRECWAEDLPLHPETGEEDLAKAVFEALVASNENPSPDEYGIEIMDYSTSEIVTVHNYAY